MKSVGLFADNATKDYDSARQESEHTNYKAVHKSAKKFVLQSYVPNAHFPYSANKSQATNWLLKDKPWQMQHIE